MPSVARTPTMHFCCIPCVALAALCLGPVCVRPVWSLDAKKVPPEAVATPQQARQTVERGLAFLEKDAAKWRKDRQCASCHHGTMTVWALGEARSQGWPVKGEAWTDVVQ